MKRRIAAIMGAAALVAGITVGSAVGPAVAGWTDYFDGTHASYSSHLSPWGSKIGGYTIGGSTFFWVKVHTQGWGGSENQGSTSIYHLRISANQYCNWRPVEGYWAPDTQYQYCRYQY